MISKLSSFVAVGLLGVSMSATAMPMLFKFQSTISASGLTLPGVSAGDIATVEVIADNGGNTLVSQSWYQADITSASISVGSGYYGTFNAPYFSNDPIFKTDGLGDVLSALFFDIDLGNTDNLGGSANILQNGIVSQQSTGFSWPTAFFDNAMSPDDWSVAPAQAPEPGSLALLGLGIAGLVASRRRKQ